MKPRIYILAIILIVVSLFPTEMAHSLAQPQWMSVIDSALQAHLNSQSPSAQISVIVTLSEQANVRGIGGRDRGERLRNLILSQKNTADRSQINLRGILQRSKNKGDVTSFTPLWIINAIAMTGTQSVINAMASQPGVQSITLDQTISGPPSVSAALSSKPTEQNLSVVNAPALWSLGYQGQGVVVANMDTGVDYTHPDLNTQWRGGTNSWYDPYGQHSTTPTDLNGHGTWTMGVMVGRDAGGTSIGMAPQAKWIAVKIFNDSNVATTSAIHLGFQWLLNPDGNLQTNDAPDVVNNSWTLSSPGCDLSFEPDLQALVAAGIMPVFAAGNYGPSSSTGASPANNPDAFAVGATDNNDLIYTYSSRGPTTCGQPSVNYPAVVAPGVNILSSDLYSSYYYSSGTSLAAPHVSGAIALLLNAYPNLTVADLRNALTGSAHDLGLAGPDNTFGNGRLDVLAAYNLIASGGVPTSTPAPTSTATPLPSLTPVSSPTSTPTLTATQLPAATQTRTLIPSATITNTPTSLPSATNTATPLPTATQTLTPIPSATITNTPTLLPSVTNTATSLPTATRTPTLIPSATITNTPTIPPSATNTATSLPTATRTPTSIPTATITATPSNNNIFADGFESGNFSTWNLVSGGTNISVTTGAAMVGSYGMQAIINGNTPSYVLDGTPANESAYHARLYFNPHSTTTAGAATNIFTGLNASGTTIFRIQYSTSGSGYARMSRQIRAGVLNNGTMTYTNWFIVGNAAHPIEITWQSNTSASFSLYIDGVLKQTLTNVNTSAYLLDQTRMGPSGGLTSLTSGTEYFDGFVSTRTSYIGP